MTRTIIVCITLMSILFTPGCDEPLQSLQRSTNRDDTSHVSSTSQVPSTSHIPDVRRKPPCGPKKNAEPWTSDATKCIVIGGANE